jgi:SAM-dependent methyltransferase
MDNICFDQLRDCLRRPALYERTTAKFWTDPHIAAQMLKSHLDPHVDAASFKHEFIDRSVGWIASLPLPEGARLLDIGCGPGLFTTRFAERGLRVTGLDFSESSIRYAREHDRKSEYVVGDYLAMDYSGEFDIITLINCDYGALIPEERRNLLRRVSRALKPGGLFLFDVFTPQLDRGKSESRTWEDNPDGGFMNPNPHICISADYYYGEIAAGCRYVIIEKGGVHCYNLWNCYFTRQSLMDEVTPIGFVEEGFYSNVAGKPYTDNTHRMCAVLRRT